MNSPSKKNDVFFDLLLNETYQNISAKSEDKQTGEDLFKYFENKIITYKSYELFESFKTLVLKNDDTMFHGEFFEHQSFLRLEIEGKKLDIPSNWSVFKRLNEDEIIYLNLEEDEDKIFKTVFTKFPEDNLFAIKNKRKVFVLLCREDSLQSYWNFLTEFKNVS